MNIRKEKEVSSFFNSYSRGKKDVFPYDINAMGMGSLVRAKPILKVLLVLSIDTIYVP